MAALVPTDAELLQAQADLWRHSLCYLTSMSLKCAVDLGIPTAIHSHGGRGASVPDLIAGLSLPAAKLPFLRRLMRLLAVSGVFTVDNSIGKEEVYGNSPLSYLLVDGIADDRHMNHTSFVLTATSSRHIEAALGLADWFKRDVVTPPFVERHGAMLFHESMESVDPVFHQMANEALDAHDNFAVDMAVREFRQLFEGIRSMTYCCTGDANTASAIVKAYPHIKCTVLACPKLNGPVPADAAIDYVEGDMLKFIPPAQVVILKLVLHHWSDDDCVKILAQCKKAIAPKKDGGKVFIGDIVIDPSAGAMYEAQLLMDIGMMTMTKGRQRDENEWSQIFTKAGFSGYKMLKNHGARGVIEVYP